MKRAISRMCVAVPRWSGYFIFWIILIGLDPIDLVVGVFTSAVATWVSLRLLPPHRRYRLRVTALPRFALQLLWQSVTAGVDVARRAFDPKIPLQPGFIQYQTGYRRGRGRNAFASLSSLLPGTLAVRDDEQGLLYHCLDVDRPIEAELARDETAVSRVIPK